MEACISCHCDGVAWDLCRAVEPHDGAAPYKGPLLVCALPTAGVRFRRRLAYCDRGRGSRLFLRAASGSIEHPLPPAPRPPPGGLGSRTRNGLARGFSRFSVHTGSAAVSGRRGADDAAGGLFAAAPQGRDGLVATLPLAGVRFYRRLAYCDRGRGSRLFFEPPVARIGPP